MSQKNSSLAVEEKEQTFSELEVNYLPELNLLINRRSGLESESLSDEPVQISGFLTISF